MIIGVHLKEFVLPRIVYKKLKLSYSNLKNIFYKSYFEALREESMISGDKI